VFDIADRFVVLDRGKVALTADRTEVKSADDLIDFMEDIAHPDGLPGLHEADEAEQRAQ
ncbi:sugar ABC transporter ATP-binding protein, partial [Mesorhizobium sp. M2C.T.Ca.TU.009.01.2.1]